MKPLYAALGDSTGVGVGAAAGGGYPQRLARLLRPTLELELVNLCQSGGTTADALADQLPRALRLSPRLVTLGIGINDLGLQIPDEAFALDLEELVAPLRRIAPAMLIANLPDLTLSPAAARLAPRSLYQQRIEVFNEHITATAARPGLLLVDLHAVSRRILPGHPELFCADGFHPSAAGYEAWAQEMLHVALAALREDTSAAV